MFAPIAPIKRGSSAPDPIPYVHAWDKLVFWGGLVLFFALCAALLRHWQRRRITQRDRDVILLHERLTQREWARLVRVEQSGVIAKPPKLGAIDGGPLETVSGVVVVFDDNSRGLLRAGVPITGLGESGSGSDRTISLNDDEPFWIAARPLTKTRTPEDEMNEPGLVAHPFRDGSKPVANELFPHMGTYLCAIGAPPRFGPRLPDLPKFRPLGLLAYGLLAAIVPFFPLPDATTVAFVGSLCLGFVDAVATSLLFDAKWIALNRKD